MRWVAPIVLALGAAGAWAQEPDSQKALEQATQARQKCSDSLAGVEGAWVSGLAGTKADYRILVTCRDAAARGAARGKLGGDSFQGLKIYWILQPSAPAQQAPAPDPAPPAAPPAFAKAPAGKPAPLAAEAKPDPAKEADPEKMLAGEATDCDIIRDYLKLKPVHHPIGNGRSLIPCQLIRRSVVGPGGGHTYVYTKHRSDCAIRLGRASQPTWADNYVAWVFQKGFTPVMRAGFTWPFELRADDKLWDAQASGELKTRLPFIREGAEWATTPSAYQKVTTPGYSGWYTTGGHPGIGWTWNQPWTPKNAGAAIPTK